MSNLGDRFNKTEKNRWTGLTISLCVAILFYVSISNFEMVRGLFSFFLSILSTVIIGAVIAYIVNPLAVTINHHIISKIVKKHQHRSWAISAVSAMLIVIAAIAGLLLIIIPLLLENTQNFVSGISDYIVSVKNLIMSLNINDESKKHLLDFVNEQTDVNGIVMRVLSGKGSYGSYGSYSSIGNAGNSILAFSSNIGSMLTNALIGLIFAFYFLVGKSKLTELLAEFFYLVIPKKHYPNFRNVWNRFNSIFTRYILCDILDAFIVGIANALFMFATGMPYIMLCSLIVAITNLAPTFGPIVGGIMCSLVLLLANPNSVIPFIIFTLVLQLLDGYVLKPRLFGTALNVPAFLILTFLVVGGKLWGIPGILLAIPLAAIISYIYKEIFIPWLKERKTRKDKGEAISVSSDK